MLKIYPLIRDNCSVKLIIAYQWLKHKGDELFPPSIRLLINKNGQSLIEFILLFSVIMGLTYFFYEGSIGNINALWENYLNLVIDDKNQKIRIGH
jgi:hypothetical protein